MSAAPIRWYSKDPRTGKNVNYDDATTAEIESAYTAGLPTHDLYLGGNKFTIVFSEMCQKNASGGSRKIMRDGPREDVKPAAPFSPDAATATLQIVSGIDKQVDALKANVHDRSRRVVVSAADQAAIVNVLDNIIDHFKDTRYRDKYNYSSDDDGVMNLKTGQPVPAYFANVTDQSIYQRKMLSLAGLRNMVLKGPEIFAEMHAQQFSGCPNDYKAKTGPHKMKYFSGTVVDLDTIVMNVKSCFREVNKDLKSQHKSTFSNEAEFLASDIARDIITTQTEAMINDFCEKMKISPKQRGKRKLAYDKSADIPKATSNGERGMWPIWHYENVGVSTIHVNVPTLPDVFGALLQAPYHLAKGFALMHLKHSSGDFTAMMDEFFEDAVSDSCFNGKWKAIELYNEGQMKLGTIPAVLDDLQAANQSIFTAAFFAADPEREKEKEEMFRLAQATKQVGADKDGSIRPITLDDIVEWMKAQDDF